MIMQSISTEFSQTVMEKLSIIMFLRSNQVSGGSVEGMIKKLAR